MSFLKIRQFSALLFITVLALVCRTLTADWYIVSRPPLPNQPDIPLVILSYFTNGTKLTQLWSDLMYGQGLQGSAIYVRYLLIPFFLLPIGKVLQDYIHRKYSKTRNYSLLYTSSSFIVFTMLWILLTATVNGIAQAEGWYWAHWPVNGVIVDVPGSFDIGTHFMAGSIFIAVALNFAFAEWFGLDQLIENRAWKLENERERFFPKLELDVSRFWSWRNKSMICELFDFFTAGSITYAISVWFEKIEALHPEDYGTWTNLRGNTYSDLIAACFFALMWIAFMYRILVPREVRTYAD